MASQATLDKASALTSKRKIAESKLNSLNAVTNPTIEQQKEIRKLRNQISDVEYQFRKDPDLISLAGENMTPADKLFLFGAASGSPIALPVMKTAGAIAGATSIVSSPKQEPAAESTKANKNTAVINTKFDTIDLSQILPNPLHEYASYTYGLSLHLLTADEYNKIVKDGNYTPNRVLIASAGRYNNTPGPNQFIRSPTFAEDFYFDNFTLETVIGLNAQSRNSNAIQYNFTLIEPYGFTLLDRIIDICKDPAEGVNCKNYLDMPYLLQIDFFGISETGEITGVIPNTTKRIPIRLNKIDIKISARGAEYAIKGAPYNHSAFDLTTLSTPVAFEVQARTVAEFFQSSESNSTEDTTSQRESGRMWNNNGSIVGPDGTIQYINPSLMTTQTKFDLGLITSYGTALNKHQLQMFDSFKIGQNDQYFFNFLDKELAESPFTTSPMTNPKDTGMVAIDKTNSINKSNTGLNTRDYDPNNRIFQINAGTHIDQVIAWVIRNSKWMEDQVAVPDGEDPAAYKEKLDQLKDKPLSWFKVVPSIELGEFDNIRNVWSRKITYHIQKYEIRNIKVDVGPGAKATTPVKSYDYIYTGKNVDILDLDIQFNALYYNALTINRSALTNVNPTPLASEEHKTKNTIEYTKLEKDPNAIMPLVNKPQVLDTRARTGSGSNSATQVTVADLEASLLTLSQADMMNVKLKILGDPTFIKQDDVFWTPRANEQVVENKTNADKRLTPDGSLKTDDGELYVNLTFRTPSDIDESIGMMNLDNASNKTKVSLFSGLYRVLKVTNEFRAGQFTQTLDLVRLVNQVPADAIKKSDNRNITVNTLPGQKAILDNYTQAPDFTTADTPKTATAIDDSAQSAQKQQDGVNNVAPAQITSEEQKLRDVNATAAETPISNRNEPVTVPPPAPASNNSTKINTSKLPSTPAPGASNAEFAASYDYKAQWFAAKASEARASGNSKLAESYEEQVPVYQGYAASRRAQ